MESIFFKLDIFKDLENLKQFYKEALKKSIYAHIDILRTFRRERFPEITPEEYIENHITLSTHNVCIDRYDHIEYKRFGEIGSSTFDSPSLFLFIFLEDDDLYDLIFKYNLKRLWKY